MPIRCSAVEKCAVWGWNLRGLPLMSPFSTSAARSALANVLTPGWSVSHEHGELLIRNALTSEAS
jgi:hypothetical protein